MKERIVLAPGANGTELVRSLARFGVNTIGLRVVNGVGLAETALMKTGVSVEETYLSGKEMPAVIASFLNTVKPYFETASFADAEALAAALNTLRMLIPRDEESEITVKLPGGEFTAKNRAICAVYELYNAFLKANKRIDSIGLIRKAIAEAKPFDAEFLTLREFPLRPLEHTLIDCVSDGTVREISLTELYGRAAKEPSGFDFTEGYGAVNEIEHILAEIYETKKPLDTVTIACADPAEYGRLLRDMTQQYEIPATFGFGIPISDTNPARLLKLLTEWDSTGYNGIDALRRILTSAAFDRSKLAECLGIASLSEKELESIAVMAGSLRIGLDGAINKTRIEALRKALETERNAETIKASDDREPKPEEKLATLAQVELLANELENGPLAVLEKFTHIRVATNSREDRAALSAIRNAIASYLAYLADGDWKTIVPDILSGSVFAENSREGCVHITTIRGALSSLRENLYVCGLSAAAFPGTPKENYLLLDSDLCLFVTDNDAPTSGWRIERKKQEFEDLLCLAAGTDVKMHLSYAGYSLSELKERNPSSVLFTLYERENSGVSTDDFRKTVRKIGYFESPVAPSRTVGQAYTDGNEVTFHPEAVLFKCAKNMLQKAWSPSALAVYFQCPLHFYLKSICGLPEPEEDDPFVVIDAKARGKLAHRLMEELGSGTMTEPQFLDRSGVAFDRFLLERPALHKGAEQKEREAFLRMMKAAFEQNKKAGNPVFAAEQEVSAEHPSGVKLHGYPDRVEQKPDGTCLIVDYKTGRKKEHVENDIETCFQAVVYAWLTEQTGKTVTGCEFRYLAKDLIVPCRYDQSMKDALDHKLEEFRNALENDVFPRVPGDNDTNCRYCKFGDICMICEQTRLSAGAGIKPAVGIEQKQEE